MAFPENRSLKQGQTPNDAHWSESVGGWIKDCGCIQYQDGLDRCDMHINQLRDEAKQEKARVEQSSRQLSVDGPVLKVPNAQFNQGHPGNPADAVTFVTVAFSHREMESIKLTVRQQVIDRVTSMLVGDLYQQMKKGFNG